MVHMYKLLIPFWKFEISLNTGLKIGLGFYRRMQYCAFFYVTIYNSAKVYEMHRRRLTSSVSDSRWKGYLALNFYRAFICT